MRLFRHGEDCVGCGGNDDRPCEYSESVEFSGDVALVKDHVTRWACRAADARKALAECARDYEDFCRRVRMFVAEKHSGAMTTADAATVAAVRAQWPEIDWLHIA